MFSRLADIPGLSERRGVGDGKWHVENFGERPGQQRFAGAGRPDHQNVALLDFHVGVWTRGLASLLVFRRRFRLDPLVMIMHCHGQSFFGVLLADGNKGPDAV